MANVYGPEIHSLPNCVLAVDAADPRSYPGTGSTWYDMSPRKNHMTQTVAAETPTYGTTGNLKYFTFGGAQQHFKSTDPAPVSNDNEFALTAIVGLAETERRNFNGIISCGLERSNAAFARFALVSYNYQSNLYGQGLGTDMWAPAGRRTTLGNSMPLDTPTVATWVIPRWQDMKTTTKIFMNGVEVPTFSYGGSEVSTTATLNPFKWYFGNWQVSRTDMDFQGRFYFVYLFNTALSDDTVNKYYHKLKSRVGH